MSNVDGLRDYFGDINRNNTKTNKSGGTNYNATFTDKKTNDAVSVDDFLNLMVAQLKNQDFMNPVDDTQYVTQLAQFATMQQMQELASYSKSNYVLSLPGKVITCAKFNVNGTIDKQTGPVQKVSLVDNEYKITVNNKQFSLDQIMEINGLESANGNKVDASNLAISAKDVTTDSVSLEWTAPSSATELKYTMYYSNTKEMDTVEEVEKNGTCVGEKNRKNFNSETLKGLHPDTTYFVNVVVTDAGGNKSVYQKATFTTKKVQED